jgi:hypothetical protein
MNRALPIVAICLSLLALAMSLVPRGDVAPPPVAVTAADDNDDDIEFLRRRIDLLEDDNRALWDRVTQLERRPMTSGDGGQVPASFAADLEKLRSEVHSIMAGDIANSEAGRAALKDLIREAQGEQQRDRITVMEERRQQQAAQQAAKWKEFSTNAHLSYAADQKLNERLAYEESERTKKMEQLRLGEATWQEVSSYLRTQRKETDDAVTSLLDDSQRSQYQQVRRDSGSVRDMNGGRPAGMQNNPNGFQRGGGSRGMKTGN